MSYYQKNYWPVIYVAASISGLAAVWFGFLLVMTIVNFNEAKNNPTFFLFIAGSLFLVSAGGCIGTFMKKWWGRGILTYISALYLLVFPIGTILGFFVLRGLFVHKDAFR